MKVQSMTKHVVRPAKPAPAGSMVTLSNNDQVMPRMPTTMLYHFSKPKEWDSVGRFDEFMSTEVLKKSLAETLSLFYPLAGRYVERANGGLDINCTNDGVELFDVVVEGNFEEAFAGWQPTPAAELLLPTFDGASSPSISSTVLLQTQVTRFDCGRVSLGVALHHNVCDGPSVASFVGAWANISSGKGVASPPMLDRSLLKSREPLRPAFDHIEYKLHPPNPPSNFPAMVARMFKFSPDALQSLKKKAGVRDHDDSSFSSYEALAGHVWKFVTKARKLDAGKVIKLGFAVDGRKRFEPPLPDNYFGNVNFYGLATSTAGDLVSNPLEYAAYQVHKAISRMTDEYMRSSLDWIEEQKSPLTIFPSFDTFLGPDLAITSWSRFPAYQVDFGWGTPEFFGIKASAWDGLAILLPSSSAGAINVLVGLTAQAMVNLQSDPEFQ